MAEDDAPEPSELERTVERLRELAGLAGGPLQLEDEELGPLRERRDAVYYDTHLMEPGQEVQFLNHPSNIGDFHRTNMQTPGILSFDQTYTILGFGLRLIGTIREEEDLLLDQFTVNPIIGDRSYGPYLGILCSVLKSEDEEPNDKIPKPGYTLKRPLVIPVRMSFSLNVSRSPEPGPALVVRAMLFGLNTRAVA